MLDESTRSLNTNTYASIGFTWPIVGANSIGLTSILSIVEVNSIDLCFVLLFFYLKYEYFGEYYGNVIFLKKIIILKKSIKN